MLTDVVTPAMLGSAASGSTASGLGTVLASAGVVLLAALLPFVLSFVGDAVAAMLRRGRAVLPVLVTAVVAGLAVAGLGVLLLQLGLGWADDAGLAGRLSGLALGLLLVCTPLAVLALVLRLIFARARARRSRPDGAGEGAGEGAGGPDGPGTDRR